MTRLLDRLHAWQTRRRHEKHIRRLRKAQVAFCRGPHISARRNGTQAVTR